MWNELNHPWQKAFELAWISFKKGSIPIGCVIIDENEEVVAEGRNQIYDQSSQHPLALSIMAHAEMTALSQLKVDDHPNVRKYTLYTTMEPCPMCFGTSVMMNIRNIVYAAHDRFAGASVLNTSMDYIKEKNISITFAGPEVEVFQLVLQTAFEAQRRHPRMQAILSAWAISNKKAVDLGLSLAKEHFFNHNISISDIYDGVMKRYYGIEQP